MNKIANNFLFDGDKLMSELHSRLSIFTYSACGRFTKHLEWFEKNRQIGNTRPICKKVKLEEVEACFAHGGTYSDSIQNLRVTVKEDLA